MNLRRASYRRASYKRTSLTSVYLIGVHLYGLTLRRCDGPRLLTRVRGLCTFSRDQVHTLT
jgi:hypothetical protein